MPIRASIRTSRGRRRTAFTNTGWGKSQRVSEHWDKSVNSRTMRNCATSEELLSTPYLSNNIDRELSERNLRDFVRSAWPIVEPSTPFVDRWHIDAITGHLQAITRGEIRNLLINVPPETHEKPTGLHV